MSEMKHTPGPWACGVRRDGSIWLSLGDRNTGPHYQGDLVASEADARLIAAAPKLLEALEASNAEVVRLRDAMFRVYATAANGGDPTPSIEKMRDVMDVPGSGDIARAAIAKATGEQP